MEIQPYLFFEGRCEEAIEFYRQTLGAELVFLMRCKDSPEPHPPGMLPPGSENKVMHAPLQIGKSTVMVSDGQCSGQPGFQGFTLSVSAADVPAAEKLFAALADGGQVKMPVGRTYWSPGFGVLTDRFGVGWMVSVGVSP